MVSLPVRMLEPKNKHPVSQASDTCLPNQWLPEQIEGSQGLGLIRSLKAVLSWSLGIGTNEKEKKEPSTQDHTGASLGSAEWETVPKQCIGLGRGATSVSQSEQWLFSYRQMDPTTVAVLNQGQLHCQVQRTKESWSFSTLLPCLKGECRHSSKFHENEETMFSLVLSITQMAFFSNTTSHALRDSAWDSNPSGKSSLIPELRGKDPAAEKGSFVLTHKEGKRMWIYPIPKSLPYPYLHKECDLLTFRVITIIK